MKGSVRCRNVHKLVANIPYESGKGVTMAVHTSCEAGILVVWNLLRELTELGS